MKKTTILMALFFVLLVFNVSADSFVVGTIYLEEMEEGNELGNANVNVTCNGYIEETTSSSEEGVVGDYVIRFIGTKCPDGSDVHVEASYGGITGSSDKVMQGSLVGEVDMAVASATVPEFGTIAAGIAVLGSICGVFLIRKRR